MSERQGKDRTGLEYLSDAGKIGAVSIGSPEQTAVGPEASLQAFAARSVLSAIDQVEKEHQTVGTGVRLSDVGNNVGLRGDVLIPLAERLRDRGLLRVVTETTFGDDVVTLTELSRELIEDSTGRRLIALLTD